MMLNEQLAELQTQHAKATKKHDISALKELRDKFSLLLNSAPEEPGIIFQVATLSMQLGFNGEAIQLFNRVNYYTDKYPESWNNLGAAWRNENNSDKAKYCFRQAISRREDSDFYNNMATLYINEGKPKEGVSYAEKAIGINNENFQAHWNLSLLLLELEDYKRGFTEYEFGLMTVDRPLRDYSNDPNAIPVWEGQKDKTVVVYGEQGIGDEVLFMSCLPDLIKDCKQVIIDCHPRLEGVIKRSFPSCIVYPTRKKSDITWPPNHKIDYKIAIGSLMRLYRSEGNFPKKTYLKPDPERVKEYKLWLKTLGDPPYIGIGWAGGAKKTRQDLRSFKVSQLKSVYEQGGTFVSMQYTEEAEDKLKRFHKDTGIKIHHFPEVVRAFDYDETIAMAAALDLCIVPNTSLVHVCGAIGAKCWTLTPVGKAWRYSNGEDMCFYGDWVKQYHKGSDKWDDAIARLSKDFGEQYG